MTEEPEKSQKSVYLPQELWGWVEQQATKNRRSMNRQIEALLAEAMAREAEPVKAVA